MLKRANAEDDNVVKGVIGMSTVMNKTHVNVYKFIILDTRTGILRIYPSAHHELEEEHDLRFAVTLTKKPSQLNMQLD